MGKKFLSPFIKLFTSFSAALLLSVPGTTEATPNQPNNEQPTTLSQKTTIEVGDFVLQRSSDTISSKSKWHSSHRSHSSHQSHRSHYSSRW